MSSANLPRPRRSRPSSLRGNGFPTHPLLLSEPTIRLPQHARHADANYVNAFCKPSINFCTFFFPSGSSNPPATEVRRPKTWASPFHMTLVPSAVGERSKPAVTETLPPATLPCPL